jgi:UDP-glucose 4-epimerase
MKALITGGLGQIGSHVAELMLARGDEVLVLDNLATGKRVHLAEHEALQIVIGSVADSALVEEVFSSFAPEVVLHAAASYKDPHDWESDTLTNCVGGANVVNAASRFNVTRFVYLQTSLCYGLHPRENPITLSHPRNPEGSSYAISKTTNELYLELSSLDYVTFRLANVIGPRNLAGPLPIFFKRLSAGSKCFVSDSRRDFVFVKDLADHVVKAFDGVGNGAYHFSSGSDVSIKVLYDEVVKALGISDYPEPDLLPLGNDDVGSILLDPSKTFQDFGNSALTPLAEIVNQAVEYYRHYGVDNEVTHLKLEG